MSYRQDDRIKCTFYNKIGACRHGDRCSRTHVRPTSSRTILLANLYDNPLLNKNNSDTEHNQAQIQEDFDQFYRDVFTKVARLGKVTSMVICENENDHLTGNVYIMFSDEDVANSVNNILNQEWYNGRPVYSELTPVDSFADANCRAYEEGACDRLERCNFMHVRKPTAALEASLFRSQELSEAIAVLAQAAESQQPQKNQPLPHDSAAPTNITAPAGTVQGETTESMVLQLFAS